MFESFFAKIAGKFISKKLKLTEGKMQDTKQWWKSQTIWAGIVASLRGIYQVLQITLPLFTGVHLPPIPTTADVLLGAVLGPVVIHGRYTADTTIG